MFKSLCAILLVQNALSFVPAPKTPSTTSLWYNYLKKDGEKKELGRLIKNIMFPGVYSEYADTAEPKKTIKIETPRRKTTSSRNGDDSFFSQDSKTGSYNMVDPSTAPKEVSAINAKAPVLKPIAKPANFVAPAPKKAALSGGGLKVLPGLSPRPQKPLILYEYEADPDCRRVREACSLLDLVVDFRPSPGGTSGFSDQMSTVTLGQRKVPFMIDNNPKLYRPQLFGATEIIEHLFNEYGPGKDKIPGSLKSNGLSGLLKSNKGATLRKNARRDNTKMRPITLYGWEGANYVRQVRETLTELSLNHILINCAEGSVNRARLSSVTGGTFQVPYIVDPNTGVSMFESAEIVKYLEQTYTI